jgi:predicted nucleotide-binding protein
LSDTSTPTALLRAEIEEVLRTAPPLATRRHDTPENHAWMGRAANVIECWHPAKFPAFAELNRQFNGRNAHEANDAFKQIIVLLEQAQRDVDMRARAGSLEGHLRQLRTQDEVILKSGTQVIPAPVSAQLAALFKDIREAFPEVNLPPFEGHAHPAVLRAQIANATQKIADHISSNSTSATPTPAVSRPTNPELVFVIHGRQLREEFHAFLRAIGLKPLEWSDARRHTGKPNPFTWEIVDQALKEAGCIVALMTPDDEARLATHLWAEHENALEKERLLQPRQNVLFEAGVAYGRAPERTLLLRIGSHRPMSDLAGHHILQLDDSPQSRQAVADALSVAGCPVDLSGSDWFRAGLFTVSGGIPSSQHGHPRNGVSDANTTAVRLLFEEADYLHRIYRGLDQDHRERVRLPLFNASWPDFGKEWDYVHATLFSHASRVTWLIRTSQAVWSEAKWPTAGVELFQMPEHVKMVDLLHALDDFRRLLRTKFS